ncbi:STAS-like domain-containing protein [Methanobrevibacter sp.]|uniref:STAS-like domain-containing protein n=1 Tax=Methanobrevibacter sp. TaxID=66852 RepID=UPI00386BEC0E
MTQIEINLSDRYKNKLGIGPTAKKIFQETEGYDKVILNFENIEFMSRSFAQEYVFQKYNSKSKVIEINMNENIEELLKLVTEEYEEYFNMTR